MNKKPLIGITCGEVRNVVETWASIIYGQSTTYSDAIIHAGGVPVLLPITGDKTVLRELYDRCDGLLFAGGNDVDPARYGQAADPATDSVSLPRDEQEFTLLTWALKDRKPLLAICRGMQALNIACGGTLYQHLPTDVPEAQDHQASKLHEDTTFVAHTLQLEPSSKLAAILGVEQIRANSQHHQAVRTVGDGVSITAHAEDGVVEGIEIPGQPFAIGVQPHPEGLEASAEPLWAKLFSAFVVASATAAKN